MDSDVIGVSAYLDRLNQTLKTERARIRGEIFGIQEYPGRSYMYFSIKDSGDGSTAKCFMWKRDFVLSGVALQDGVEVIIQAYPSIYKPNGGMTLQVEMIELVGEGVLQIAYEKLKTKLRGEGLFDIDRKRSIPDLPQKIGVITSRSGAVINDFLSNIDKCGYEILFVDSKVEGQDAVRDLLAAVKTLKNKNLDVLVIMRGGGSLESFQAFNNEVLIREVSNFPTPVITGIGHDKDEPLLSLISDKNVSTPTAVANLLNSSWIEGRSDVVLAEERITRYFEEIIDIFYKAEDSLNRAIDSIAKEIRNISDLITQHTKDIVREFDGNFTEISQTLDQSKRTIELGSPERQLSLGYSIVKHKGKVLRSKKGIVKGERLEVQVRDGIINTITT